MIDDSFVWKDRLRRARALLRRKLREGANDAKRQEIALVEAEAFTFLTGYIVRKLIEARKLSDELEAATMAVTTFPARSDYRIDFLSSHKVDRAYDLTKPQSKTIGLRALCNLIVHSFVYLPATDEEGRGLTGFFINSDRTRTREVIFVASDDFDVLVDEVLRDSVVMLSVDRRRNSVQKSRGTGVTVPSLNASR